MSKPFRITPRAWVVVLLFCAGGFLVWVNSVRVRRVEYASGIGGSSASARPPGMVRRLIVPEHNNETYHAIVQTQQMLEQGQWRVRHIDYENAPAGHDIREPSPYRWWLGLVASIDRLFSGRSPAAAVEHASLFADPLLHFLLLAGATIFVAWQFGAFPAALLAIGLVTIFPFAAEFLPGAADDRGLAQVCAFASALPLLAGIAALYRADAPQRARASRRWFFLAGAIGGCGLWVNVLAELPMLGGIALGGLLAAWVVRREAKNKTSAAVAEKNAAALPAAPWMAWAIGGAAVSLVGYVIEYAPHALLSWQLRFNHPLYALAWIGAGVVLSRSTAWIERRKSRWNLSDIIVVVAGLAAIVAVPVVIWTVDAATWGTGDPSSFRLTKLWDGAIASSVRAWIARDGFSAAAGGVLLPLLLIAPALVLIVRATTRFENRALLAVAFGPVLVALALVWRPLGVWSGIDATLLVLLVATTVAISGPAMKLPQWSWFAFAVLMFVPGVFRFFPPSSADGKPALTKLEVDGLVERDIARWLANHAGKSGGVVLAPPGQTTTLYFYGGLRGLGTLSWENRDGLGVAVRIASAMTLEEAKELIDGRGITHLVIPSWDPYFEIYARMGMGQVEGTFLSQLRTWNLPPWLRPLPYQLPGIPGFEKQLVTILEVVEPQDDAPALSRTAEYFLEMGQVDRAVATAQALRRFPADVGALVARALVEIDHGDAATFGQTFDSLMARLNAKRDRFLPWDRRVSLAVILARKQRADLAREQIGRCVAEVDEARLRSLTTGSLYRFLVLSKAYNLPIADPQLHAVALSLLPPEARERIER